MSTDNPARAMERIDSQFEAGLAVMHESVDPKQNSLTDFTFGPDNFNVSIN